MTRYLALVVTAVLWASAFPAIRAGLAGYQPGHLVLLRFLAASIALAIVCVVRRCPLPSNRDMPRIALLGILGMTLYPLVLSYGEKTVEAGTASVIVNLSPALTAIFAAYAIGERLNAIGWIGTGVAFTGCALVSMRGGLHTALTPGLVAVFLAAVIQALQFVVAKSLLRRYDAVSLTVFSVFCGTAVDLVFARGFVHAVTAAPRGATLAVLYLGVIATVLATITWSYGLARVSAPIATSFLYLVGPLSILVSYVWLHEVPTALTWAGSALTIAGVAIVKFSDTAMPRRALAAGVVLLVAVTVRGESLTIGRVDRPPHANDFASMAPPPELAAQLTRVDAFVQRNPTDGAPVSERTEAWLGYDTTNLYAVFICFDAQPSNVRAQLARRDDVLSDDFVTIQLDTFRDQRRAYVFGANAFGIQLDAIWVEGTGFDPTFDTVWHSEGRRTERGYVAVFQIPFASLRFPRSDAQSWGILLTRDIPRRSEESFWPRYSKRVEGRLNQMAVVEGISGISPPQNVQAIPYSSARAEREMARSNFTRGDAGVDAKLIVNDSFVVDATLNPDFSQVESDEPQLSANQRFELQYPEKRPFFLENASYFSTPMQLLFTRRIGDPRFGLRWTGKNGPWGVGALVSDDQSGNGRTTNAVFRLSHDLARQSSIGVLYTGRHGDGAANDVTAIDGRWKLNENWVASFQAAGSNTTGRGRGTATYLNIVESGPRSSWNVEMWDRSPEFATQLGFVPRVDNRYYFHDYRYFWYPKEQKSLTSTQFINFTQVNQDHAGHLLDWTLANGVQWNFTRQSSLRVYLESGNEHLLPREFPEVASEQVLHFWDTGFIADTALVRWMTVHLSFQTGRATNYFPAAGHAPESASYYRHNFTLTFRPSNRFTIENRYLDLRLWSRDGAGRIFRSTIARSKWNYQITPSLAVRTIAQYDRVAADSSRTSLPPRKNFNADFLVSYIIHPGTAIFAGYNGNYRPDPRLSVDGDDRTFISDRKQVFIKVSYLLRY